MTFKPSLDREVGEIHTKVNMILRIAERDTVRIDKLEEAENKRFGRQSIYASTFGMAAGFISHYISKLF